MHLFAPRSSSSNSPSQPSLPKLEVFIRYKDGATAEKILEAVEIANKKGPDRIRIATNLEIDLALQTGTWEEIRNAFPLWTGTGFAYVGAGKKFRDEAEKINGKYYLVFTDPRTKERCLFPIPEQHLDVMNGILIAEHPDLSLIKDGNDRIVVAKEIDLVEKFPTECGHWLIPDPKHGIPCGKKKTNNDPNARLLVRRLNKLVSLDVRDYGCGNWGRYNSRGVLFDYAPSEGFGVAVVREKREIVFDGPDPYRSPPRIVPAAGI